MRVARRVACSGWIRYYCFVLTSAKVLVEVFIPNPRRNDFLRPCGLFESQFPISRAITSACKIILQPM